MFGEGWTGAAMVRFVVAARRGSDLGVGEVGRLVEASGGLEVVGDSNPNRLTVEGEDAAALRLREAHGDVLLVEAVVLHDPL